MQTMRELEAQAKALAPVFSKLLDQSCERIRKEFQGLLDEQSRVIKSFKEELSSKLISEESIVEKLLPLIPMPKDGEPGNDADLGLLKENLTRISKEFHAFLDEQSGVIKSLKDELSAKLISEDAIVEKLLPLIPMPKNGESGNDADLGLLKENLERISKEFQAFLDEQSGVTTSLKDELSAKLISEESIVEKLLPLIPKPMNGEPGRDADMDFLQAHLEELVKALPVPENGKSVTVEDVAPLIVEEVGKAVAQIPSPENGKSVTAEDVRPLLSEMVEIAVKSIPEAKPGKDADMEALRKHLDSLLKGIEPPKPASAEEIAATFERRFSDLILSWERQARDTFDKAADRMPTPKDGENGRDALPLESFDLFISDDGRTVIVKLQAGETIVEKSVKIAAVIDRGVYSSEKSSDYDKGDGATYGGCYWIAQKDAPEGAPGGSGDWRLAVKKGRDGRDGTNGKDLTRGVKIT